MSGCSMLSVSVVLASPPERLYEGPSEMSVPVVSSRRETCTPTLLLYPVAADPPVVCDEPFSVIDPARHVTEAPLWLTDEPGMEITPLALTGVAESCEPLTACAMVPKLGLLQLTFTVPVEPVAEFELFTV